MGEPANYYAADQVQELIQRALQQRDEEHAQASSGSINAEQAQAMIDQALARQAAVHNDQLQALAASMRGTVASLIAEHAGGPGTQIAETWSQWEQEQARAASEASRR